MNRGLNVRKNARSAGGTGCGSVKNLKEALVCVIELVAALCLYDKPLVFIVETYAARRLTAEFRNELVEEPVRL